MPAVIDLRAREARHISPEARKVLRNTYALLGLTMLPTVVGALIGIMFPITFYLGIWGHLGLFIATIFGMQFLIVKNRNNSMGVNLLLLFTAMMGYFMGPLLHYALQLSNGVELIGVAFIGTAATFFVLAGYATFTTRNFATPGIFKTLFIGMVMAFVMGLFGAFLNMPVISLAVSAIFIPIASAFIVFTINNIIRGGETNYIMATMTVYIMLLNIFQALLHLLMAFAGGRD